MMLMVLAQTGCRNDAPPTPNVPVPASGNRDAAMERDYVKPMPPTEDWREPRAAPPASDPSRNRN